MLGWQQQHGFSSMHAELPDLGNVRSQQREGQQQVDHGGGGASHSPQGGPRHLPQRHHLLLGGRLRGPRLLLSLLIPGSEAYALDKTSVTIKSALVCNILTLMFGQQEQLATNASQHMGQLATNPSQHITGTTYLDRGHADVDLGQQHRLACQQQPAATQCRCRRSIAASSAAGCRNNNVVLYDTAVLST
jgi:hypothetical protein